MCSSDLHLHGAPQSRDGGTCLEGATKGALRDQIGLGAQEVLADGDKGHRQLFHVQNGFGVLLLTIFYIGCKLAAPI